MTETEAPARATLASLPVHYKKLGKMRGNRIGFVAAGEGAFTPSPIACIVLSRPAFGFGRSSLVTVLLLQSCHF